MDQRIGTQLGNYWIVEVIARGAYGLVYRAEHVHLGHSVAIKFLHAYLHTPQQQASFRQEAQTLAKLRHPHIVRLHDFGIDESPYLVSEYAPGGSLRDHLAQQAPQPLPLRAARPILAHIGHALAYIHSQGIIHRDLKPENILFDRDGRALLADFGLAKVKRTVSASSAASLVGLGTPPYMAPEQFQGKGEPLPQSDQYALGCIAYELLTGQLPFTADNIGAYGFQHLYALPEPLRLHNPMLSPRIEHAVLTALAKHPAERYATVEAFLVALGIHQPAPTLADFPSEATLVARRTAMSGSDDPTLVKQPEQARTEGRILTERSPHRLVSSSQLPAPRLPPATVPLPSTPIPTTTRSAFPSFQTSESARDTPSLDTLAGAAPTRQIPSLWKRVQALVAGASALTVTKRLFLLAALIDLLLLLGGLWLGRGPLALVGTMLAIGMCVCGLALNFLTQPWIWIVVFLLLSPLSGALYTLAVNVIQADGGIMNWHTFCAYLLLTPAAGILYGLFGSPKHRDESLAPSFTRKLTLTVWFLGAGIFVVGFGAPMLLYVGLAWALASGILAVAQIIRLKQWEWLGTMVLGSAMVLGIPVFMWGLAYGVFGPTVEDEQH